MFVCFCFCHLRTRWKGTISSCTHLCCLPALWWQTANMWWVHHFVTCIMYSIWDISFSGLAVLPSTHSDQHIFWGCNNQRNAAVMWEPGEVTWHNGVAFIVLLSSFLTSLISLGAQQKCHELNRVKHGPGCKTQASISEFHDQRKRENSNFIGNKLPSKLCGSRHMRMSSSNKTHSLLQKCLFSLNLK